MITVEFATPSEFLAELRKDSRHVDRRIVRVAECRRTSAISSVLLVSVVGTACVGADIYRVESICGPLCGIERNDRRVLARMRKQFRRLRYSCASLGLDVRSGTRHNIFYRIFRTTIPLNGHSGLRNARSHVNF